MLRFILFYLLLFSLKAHSQPVPENIILGTTTGEFPYLNYGLGEDRLGGAKMGYLDTAVVVKVVDSVVGHYKVMLSGSRYAYLPRTSFRRDNSLATKAFNLAGSWIIRGDSLYDYISISLDERLPYQARQEVNPARIIVDIFGATNNTNWVNHLSTATGIRNVSHEQIEDDIYRVTIDLENPHHWGYKIYYEEKRLIIRVKKAPASLRLDHLTIAIDAGHGGNNGGAGGKTTRISEKEYTLKIAKQVEAALVQEGAKVFMTRQRDVSLSMNERWKMIDDQFPDIMLSIHLNSSSKDSIQGASTFYRYPGFRPLSKFILSRMLETGLKEFGNIGSFNFALMGATEYPNCLIEVAFLSNKEDETRILDPQFHKDVAVKIVEGIKDWLKSME